MTSALLLFGIGCAGSAQYSASASIDTPQLIMIEPDVQVVADYHEPVFYSDSYYWRYDNGVWFRSDNHVRGWVRYEAVPPRIRRIERPTAYIRYRGEARGNAGGQVRDQRDYRSPPPAYQPPPVVHNPTPPPAYQPPPPVVRNPPPVVTAPLNPPPPMSKEQRKEERKEAKQDAKEIKQEAKEERKEAKAEAKAEAKFEAKVEKAERKEAKQEAKQEAKEERKEAKEAKEAKQDAKDAKKNKK